jgi:hypothetical protein
MLSVHLKLTFSGRASRLHYIDAYYYRPKDVQEQHFGETFANRRELGLRRRYCQ